MIHSYTQDDNEDEAFGGDQDMDEDNLDSEYVVDGTNSSCLITYHR